MNANKVTPMRKLTGCRLPVVQTVLLAASVLALSGCYVFQETPAQVTPPAVVHADGVTRRAVVFGLDRVDPACYGGWDGECPGTILDATRMRDMLASRGYTVTLLTNAQATAYRVTAACVAAAQGMKEGDKLYVYGSSHGGQVEDVSGDENGGKDSTVCLWDGQFEDDLVWEVLLKVPGGVEVDMVNDSCNSGTVYRGPHDYVRVFRARQRAGSGELKCLLTHMAGCPDGKSSYGGEDGGVFTSALLASGPGTLSRIGWFDAACKKMPRNQTPVYSELGIRSVKNEGAVR